MKMLPQLHIPKYGVFSFLRNSNFKYEDNSRTQFSEQKKVAHDYT